MRIDTEFCTGNGVVAVDGDEVVLDRDLRDSTGERWYWHLCVTADEDTVVRIRLARPGLIGRFGPAIRTAGEYHWLWGAAGPDGAFDIQVSAGSGVYASATIPYGLGDLAAFRGRLSDVLRWGKLTRSEGGLEVPMAVVQAPEAERVILLTCRHHACEAMASFVVEGAVEQFIGLRRGGNPLAQGSELVCVPMMDVDGVHAGDQGKARMPWDHNRDYGPRSRYRAVAALREKMARERRAIYALDLHTPGLRGDVEEQPYVVASDDTGDAENARELLDRLNGANTSRLRGPSSLLVFDQEWNSASSSGQRCGAAWLRSLPMTCLATTIEYPNAVDRGVPVTPAAARGYGSNLLGSLLAMVE